MPTTTTTTTPARASAPPYLAPYLSAVARHGVTVEALLWAGEHTQSARFDAMRRIHPLHGKRLLDVGCGRADLLDHLHTHGVRPAHYVGLEAVDEFADAAQAKHLAHCTIVRADFVREPQRLLVGAEVILFSGSLNTLDRDAFFGTVRTAFAAAGEAIVFNFLSSPLLAGQPWLRWYRAEEILNFARRLAPHVAMLDDYLAGDCTVAFEKGRGPDVTSGGRIDVHSHLLPGVDDGCASLIESLQCARELVAAGYTHSFVTPHVWPSTPQVHIASIRQWTADLQLNLDNWHIPLKLMPGGEISLTVRTMEIPPDQIVTYGLARRHVLFDFWAEKLPPFFEPTVRWFQSLGFTCVLAHPERMRAVQDEPALANLFADLGVLLQGNLQCFSDPPHAATRRTVERFLVENRYFMLGTDLHNRGTLPARLDGLKRATALAGKQTIERLTIHNPRTLLA